MKKLLVFPVVPLLVALTACGVPTAEHTKVVEDLAACSKQRDEAAVQSNLCGNQMKSLTAEREALRRDRDALQARIGELTSKAEKAEQLEKATQTYQDLQKKLEREILDGKIQLTEPKTQFLILHKGVSEDLAYMAETLNRYPNSWVEFGARIGELGRQPRAARKFFDTFQDRILFGTDAIPRGDDTPQQVFGDKLYEIYYRFLETEDEYFDYSPAKTPHQGRWRISGLGLPEQILRKVYHQNAERLLHLDPATST